MCQYESRIERALDALNMEREVFYSISSDTGAEVLWCSSREITTRNYENYQIITKNPDRWDPVGISTHANTYEVADFLFHKLEHQGIDGEGQKGYISLIHLPQFSVYWDPENEYFVYGQYESNDQTMISFATEISIVAHEIFHSVNHYTNELRCHGQPGALNESLCDIFGIILDNYYKGRSSIGNWKWEIGIPETANPLHSQRRDLSQPSQSRPRSQPEHMNSYDNTTKDQGGVHINNGIHNKAAYYLLTSKDSEGNYLFNAGSAGLLFYQALIRLRPSADFIDSKLALLEAALSCFPIESQSRAICEAINNAFDQVGIQ